MWQMESMKELAQSLGIDKTVTAPLANSENKDLAVEIDNIRRYIVISKHEINGIKEKLNIIDQHKTQARLERTNCEEIIASLRRNTEHERHLYQISERQLGRVKQDIVKINKRTVEVMEKSNIYENMNYAKSMELEDIKNEMQWNQQDLEKYLAECNHQEDLSKYLERYTREDNSKADVLNHEISDLVNRRAKVRKRLDDLVIDTKILQVELDKTAEQYRDEYSNRKEVIHMWRVTLDNSIKLDGEINKYSNDLVDVKVQMENLQEEIDERKRLANNITTGNTDLEKSISRADREKSNVKDMLSEILKKTDSLKRELSLLKTTIERTIRECEVARVSVKQMRIRSRENKLTLKMMEGRATILAEKYQQIEAAKENHDLLLTLAEDMFKEEEIYHSALNDELNKLRERQFKLGEQLISVREHKRNKEAEITTTRANIRSLIYRQGMLEKDLLQLDELIYKTDLNIQHLEHKIARMETDSTNQELVDEMHSKIKMLTAELNHVTSIIQQLDTMITNIINEANLYRLNIEKIKDIKTEQEGKIVAEDLIIESSIRQRRETRKRKEEQLVFRNLEKFSLKQLEAKCRLHLEKVTDIELKEVKFNAVITQRRTEIRFFKEILTKDLRKLEEERTELNRQLQHVKFKVATIQSRLDIANKANKDDDGDPIKANIATVVAKEETKRYGDQLDLNIQKTEREIRALENTVVLLNSANENFRFNKAIKVPRDSEETRREEQANKDLKNEQKLHSYKRYEMRMVLKEIEKIDDVIKGKKEIIQEINDRINEVRAKMNAKSDEFQKTQAKLQRANNDTNMLRKFIDGETFSINDIRLRVNIYMLGLHITESMQHLGKHFPEIWEEAGHLYFEQYNFEIPSYLKVTKQENNENSYRLFRPSINQHITTTRNNNNCPNTIGSVGSRSIPISVVDLADNISLCGTNQSPAGRKTTSIQSPQTSSARSCASKVISSRSSKSSCKQRGVYYSSKSSSSTHSLVISNKECKK